MCGGICRPRVEPVAAARYALGVKDALIVSLLSLVPRNRAAWLQGFVARTWLSRWVCRTFVRAYGLDMSEASRPLGDYRTLAELFTRELRPGVRPIDDAPDALVSPADGRVAAVGTTRTGRVDVAPGRALDVRALLGGGAPSEFDVIVIYLSPRDYHRVHVAREGRFVRWIYLPGTLWPVFPAAVRGIDNLFARNERMVVEQHTDAGPLWTVLVGAFGVGRIEVVDVPLLSNDGAAAASHPAVRELGRGDWLGTFHLGSTVILAAPVGTWRAEVSPGDVTRVGRPVARRVATEAA